MQQENYIQVPIERENVVCHILVYMILVLLELEFKWIERVMFKKIKLQVKIRDESI